MSDLIEGLRSSWWLSVVVAAFLVNILSAYTKPALDRLLSAFSAARRRKTEEAAVRRQDQVARIQSSPDLQVLLLLDEIRSMLVMFFGYACVVGLLVLSANYATGWEDWVLVVGALLLMVITIQQQSRATGIAAVLRDAGVKPWESLKSASPNNPRAVT